MEQLTEDDLAYHERVTAQIAQAEAVAGSWFPHLYAKYELTPGRDKIHPDGRIERGEPVPSLGASVNGDLDHADRNLTGGSRP